MNPIFEPRPMAPPVRRREKACQSPSSQALGPSPQDERTACRHHYFRWVLGKGAALPWGSPPPSSTQGTAWQEGRGGHWPSQLTPKHTLTDLAHSGISTARLFLGWGLPWAAAAPLHQATVVSSAHCCQARPWIPMRWSSRTRTPISASPGLTCGPTWGRGRLPAQSYRLCLWGPAPQSPSASCGPLMSSQGPRAQRGPGSAQQGWAVPASHLWGTGMTSPTIAAAVRAVPAATVPASAAVTTAAAVSCPSPAQGPAPAATCGCCHFPPGGAPTHQADSSAGAPSKSPGP